MKSVQFYVREVYCTVLFQLWYPSSPQCRYRTHPLPKQVPLCPFYSQHFPHYQCMATIMVFEVWLLLFNVRQGSIDTACMRSSFSLSIQLPIIWIKDMFFSSFAGHFYRNQQIPVSAHQCAMLLKVPHCWSPRTCLTISPLSVWPQRNMSTKAPAMAAYGNHLMLWLSSRMSRKRPMFSELRFEAGDRVTGITLISELTDRVSSEINGQKREVAEACPRKTCLPPWLLPSLLPAHSRVSSFP